jgi:hypothetical protein
MVPCRFVENRLADRHVADMTLTPVNVSLSLSFFIILFRPIATTFGRMAVGRPLSFFALSAKMVFDEIRRRRAKTRCVKICNQTIYLLYQSPTRFYNKRLKNALFYLFTG